MPRKRPPTIVDEVVWEKVTKVRLEEVGIARSRKYGRIYGKPRRDTANR